MPTGSQLFTDSKKDAIVFTTYSSQQEVQMAEQWIRDLAGEVVRKLSLKKGHLEQLDERTYFFALRMAAKELSIDLGVAGRWEYACNAVKRIAQALVRTEDHPIGTTINALNGGNDWVPWIEATLPPGDRD